MHQDAQRVGDDLGDPVAPGEPLHGVQEGGLGQGEANAARPSCRWRYCCHAAEWAFRPAHRSAEKSARTPRAAANSVLLLKQYRTRVAWSTLLDSAQASRGSRSSGLACARYSWRLSMGMGVGSENGALVVTVTRA